MTARPRGGKPAGEVRIIGGQWRRSRLPVPDAAGLRPTPDRVRETLFNWLGQDLGGWRCCDPFAGSGALGLEAASRGAASVLLVERDATLVRSLQASVARLGGADRISVRAGDGVSALRALPTASQDLIFLDPPYDSGLLSPALTAAQGALAPGGWLYLEDRQARTTWPDGWAPYRELKAGVVHATLLRRMVAAAADLGHTLGAP